MTASSRFVRVILTTGACLAALGTARSQDAKGSSGMDKNMIVVTGSAEVRAVPDLARINVGVVTSAATAAAALAENNQSMNAQFAVIKAQGVADKDIRTSNLSVQPQYSQPQPGQRGEFVPRVVGYQVTNTVYVTLRQIDKLGPILDVLIANGANQVYGISFDIDKADELLDKVRGQAVADARRLAELYCSGDKVKPGRILQIEESGGDFGPRPMMEKMGGMRAMAMAAPAPVAAGESSLEVRVRVAFSLEPRD
jgi:uncharacterized protein YggE